MEVKWKVVLNFEWTWPGIWIGIQNTGCEADFRKWATSTCGEYNHVTHNFSKNAPEQSFMRLLATHQVLQLPNIPKCCIHGVLYSHHAFYRRAPVCHAGEGGFCPIKRSCGFWAWSNSYRSVRPDGEFTGRFLSKLVTSNGAETSKQFDLTASVDAELIWDIMQLIQSLLIMIRRSSEVPRNQNPILIDFFSYFCHDSAYLSSIKVSHWNNRKQSGR